MDSVAPACKTERHHPEWSNVYNRVFVRWTTHNPAGLSEKDTKMAGICDELAARPESQEIVDEDPTASSSLKQTADQVVAIAGDCCTPQKKPLKEKEKQRMEEVESEEGAKGSVAGMGGQPS